MDIKFNTQIVDISVALTALKHYRAGNYKMAIESLLKILDAEPNNWDARLMLAASYYKTAQYAAAERAFAKLNENCPDEDIRVRAAVGLKASTERLHQIRTEETGERPAAPKEFTKPAASLPQTSIASTNEAGDTPTNFLKWLDRQES